MGNRMYISSIKLVNGENNANPNLSLSECDNPDCHLRHPTEVFFNSRQGLHFGPSREFAIMIDGSCLDNGSTYARAGAGVYFGHNSPLNISMPIKGIQTSQRAEIRAAIGALRRLKDYQLDTDEHLTGVVLISDSANLVNAMTKHIDTWSQNHWKNSQGEQVADAWDFAMLEHLVYDLETRGFSVRFWHVPRMYNYHADRLAKLGAARSSAGRPVLLSATPRAKLSSPPLNCAPPRDLRRPNY